MPRIRSMPRLQGEHARLQGWEAGGCCTSLVTPRELEAQEQERNGPTRTIEGTDPPTT